jgi:EAL domain-containing protein (putative c-di-GMP-specific phosphodiesterase class I)
MEQTRGTRKYFGQPTALGIKTVAEYVETEACLDVLRGLGVNYAQGFALGRPAPVATLNEGVV